ncbi:MAG: hypothetical protein WB586_16325 [Chthoniobacterales bacterium]
MAPAESLSGKPPHSRAMVRICTLLAWLEPYEYHQLQGLGFWHGKAVDLELPATTRERVGPIPYALLDELV